MHVSSVEEIGGGGKRATESEKEREKEERESEKIEREKGEIKHTSCCATTRNMALLLVS